MSIQQEPETEFDDAQEDDYYIEIGTEEEKEIIEESKTEYFIN